MPKVVRSPSDVLAENPLSTTNVEIKVAGAEKAPVAEVAAPTAETVPVQPPQNAKTAAPGIVYRFVKNINPGEKIRFRDGSTFKFPAAKFVTSDPVMAEKISAVGAVYNIVQQ